MTSAPGLAIHCRTFCLPRRDHSASETQDACAADTQRGRFAVADGVTESAWSGLWAKLLVKAFVHSSDDPPAWPGWIGPAQERWCEMLRLPPQAEPLPWFLQEQYEQGSFATFLGLVIQGERWHAVCVGDSCLFQARPNVPLRAFPLTRSSQFNNTPALIGSRSLPDELLRDGLEQAGNIKPGDRLWLMTDALACWFLSEVEAGHQAGLHLEDLLKEPDAFQEWIDGLRTERKLRNDDVTLVAVCVEDNARHVR